MRLPTLLVLRLATGLGAAGLGAAGLALAPLPATAERSAGHTVETGPSPGAGRLAQAQRRPAPGEEGGIAKGCPPGTIQKPETDDCIKAPAGREGSGNPVPGRSLGGVLRRGPAQESARVSSLSEGQRITILRNTGVVWNNYPWFEIRAGGTTGFKWGGILCADVPMPGVFEVCKGSPAAPPPAPAAAPTQPLPAPAAAGGTPSWCPTARLPAEHAICGNPDLGRLDGVLNTAYQRATFDSRRKRAEIDHEHRRWIGRRNACGNDSRCIERRYSEQIQFLESFFGN